jgi:ribonuclease R
VHEEPDARRLQEYRDEVLSHHVPCGNLGHRAEVQKLLHRLGTLAIGPALKIGFLKSLMRARYAVEPLGHYGLAKKHYAHFTSPIRRYADLVVHRALFEQGHGPKHSLKETADHISNTERNSADAERDSRDVKLYAFLNAQLKSARPQRYPALVTDLRNFGFFVDVTGLAMSGLVPFSELKDDFYAFDAARLQVVGRRTRRVIKLGDRLEVQVARVDRFKKQVDFRLAQSQPAQAARHVRSAPPTPGRRNRETRTFERPGSPRQARGGSQRRPGSPRPLARDGTLRSSHSSRPAIPGARQNAARPDRQNRNRDQNSAQARKPGIQQQGRNARPSQHGRSRRSRFNKSNARQPRRGLLPP